MELKLFSGSANPELARAIAASIGMELGNVLLKCFPEGELFVKFLDHIRNADVFIIQPTCPPTNDNLMELLIMLDAAKRASAGRITTVVPYYGYARQDRKDQPRVPITAKLVANLLVSAGSERILTMDLHSQQIQGFFDIPVDHLYGAPVVVKHLREMLAENAVVVAPDSGGVKMAHAYADMLGYGFAVVAKRRISAELVESSHLVGDVLDRDCVVVDDLTTTAGTLINAAVELQKAGARRVFAAVSHSCLTEAGYAAVENSPLTQLVTTDSIPQKRIDNTSKIKVLSVAGLLGEAIRRIHEGSSVSSLFQLETAGEAKYIL